MLHETSFGVELTCLPSILSLTSGPLLLSVSENVAFSCLEQLRSAGFSDAAIIGEVVNEPGIAVNV
jgi:hydrogenase maturation factor